MVSDGLFRFACYVAICDLKFGPSYASVSAERIFNQVTQLGGDLPARLKRDGTEHLPGELAAFRGAGMSAKANDALAVIRITVRKKRGRLCAGARLPGPPAVDHGLPALYAIEFRGPTRHTYPSRFAKEGRAPAVRLRGGYPALHPAIEAYARQAMREYEWYTNLDAEDCAMPGSFAVFALGCASAAHAPLVLDYLALADGEHQSMHGRYVEGYLDAHGFTREAIAYLLACAGNIQHLRHRKTYAERIANADSLGWLLEARRRVAGDALLDRGAARESLGRARRRGGIPGRAPCDLGRAGGQGSRRPGDPQGAGRCAPCTRRYSLMSRGGSRTLEMADPAGRYGGLPDVGRFVSKKRRER